MCPRQSGRPSSSRAEIDVQGFDSRRANARERRQAGRALRAQVPRSAHADGGAEIGRDPIAILAAQATSRVPEIIGIRHSRMALSPSAYLRGAAAVMAADLKHTPATGPEVQLCGDAHIRNFGTFATPERNLTFSINDFDETLPGPWEWDVKRFAASLYVVAQEHGFSPGVRRDLVISAVAAYRQRIARYANMTNLEVWYDIKGIDDVLGHYSRDARAQVERDITKASRREHAKAIDKLTWTIEARERTQTGELAPAKVRFREDPPVQVHFESAGLEMAEALETMESYRESLLDDKRVLVGRYAISDIARRVVGVGSVGTKVWICLRQGESGSAADRIVLQVKQAQPSALEPYLQPSAIAHAGRRVVAGQRLTQGPTDSFLGWGSGPHRARQYYVRQLWDRKGRSDLTTMTRSGLTEHATLCAWALASAHARSGDSAMISGYLGTANTFDQAIAVFAERYAGVTRSDHAELLLAVADGRLPGSDVV